MKFGPMLLGAVFFLAGVATAQDAKKPEAPQAKEMILPATTPFDGDKEKREGYLVGFSNGYAWAKGFHLFCPTNPGKGNLHVIRGWVEGWQAGVRDGGQAALPARYLPYLVWRPDAKD